MFFVFWTGQKTQALESGRGRFHCPVCHADRPYVRYSLTSRTTLYSLVPVGKGTPLGEMVECGVCASRFETSVLREPRPGQEGGTIWVCQGCGNVNPLDRPDCLKCGRPR